MTKDYFPEEPFGCRCGCGLSAFDPKMRAILNMARELVGRPLVVNSGCRCPAWNAHEGGKQPSPSNPYGSAHLPGPDGLCHAADIACEDPVYRYQLFRILQALGIRRFELSQVHLHADNALYLPAPVLVVLWLTPEKQETKV